jgi:hypothetical protein
MSGGYLERKNEEELIGNKHFSGQDMKAGHSRYCEGAEAT